MRAAVRRANREAGGGQEVFYLPWWQMKVSANGVGGAREEEGFEVENAKSKEASRATRGGGAHKETGAKHTQKKEEEKKEEEGGRDGVVYEAEGERRMKKQRTEAAARKWER